MFVILWAKAVIVVCVWRLTHQFDIWAAQKGADLSRCARTRIAIVNNVWSFLVRFPNFSKDM